MEPLLAKREYRPDIDGLRALAVMAVVLFHAAPNVVPGGFVGVDVFFVISGFLITRNILLDAGDGSFSFWRFYVRRIRRLFPALFVTVALSLLASIILLTPEHLGQFGASALYSLGSVANIYFWQQTGYFDAWSTFKPLLHFWSLGVEEQFYLVWPLTIVAILWLRPRLLLPVLLLLAAASLIAAQLWVQSEPLTAFYLTPFRIWEFAIGAACLWSPKLDGWLEELVFAAGLLLIASSSLLYTNETPFPGVNALAPCLGVALAITAGRAKLAWILRNPIAVWIGLISYSLYLVHWPLIVFYRYWTFAPLSMVEQIGLISASVLIAFLMYKLVEQPFRRTSLPYGLRPITAGGLAIGLLAITVIPSYFAWQQSGWPWRLTGQAALYWKQIGAPWNGIECNKPRYPKDGTYLCEFGEDHGEKFDAVLLGDSHAWHWIPGLDALFRKNHLAGAAITGGGTLLLRGGTRYDGSVPTPSSNEWARNTDDFILRSRPPVVIISARWSMYTLTIPEPGEEAETKFFTYKQYQDLTPSSSSAAVRAALIDTVQRYKDAGIQTILFGQVPYPGSTTAECMTRPNWILSPKTGLACQQTTKAEALTRSRATDALLLEIGGKFPDAASVFLFSDAMCSGKPNCVFLDENGSYYWRYGHLSYYGSVELADRYMQGVISIVKREMSKRDIVKSSANFRSAADKTHEP